MQLWNWLYNLNSRDRKSQRHRKNPNALAQRLEERTLPSVSVLLIGGTELNISSDDGDSIQLGVIGGNVLIQTAAPGELLAPNLSIGSVPAANLQSIIITGGDQENTIDLSRVLAIDYLTLASISVRGGHGDDTLIGSPDIANQIFGEDGDDTITGGDGNDTLDGTDGGDSITGGAGNDSILGGDGADAISADGGNDTILSGSGADTISTGDGDDSVFAGNGEDSILGEAGNDTLNGDGGTDSVDGGDGDDSILGGESNDTLQGGLGADFVNGQSGNDLVFGDLAVTTTSVTAFSTNFDSGVPAELSGTTTVAPVQGYVGIGTGTNVFGGNLLENATGGTFANPGSIPQTSTTLTLTNLPNHTSIDINFLLAIINSWTSLSSAPDVFNVRVDGVLVFSSTFDNITPPSTPAYVAPPGGQLTPRPFTDLGFPTTSSPFDSAWDMGFEPQLHNIPHIASTLTIDFFANGAGFQGGTDESWGIDHLEVILNGVPIPNPIANDTLHGGNGHDTLDGGVGNDLINGGLDNDIALGNVGDDTMYGGSGRDSLLGDGPDLMSTETGNDVIQGQGGNDTVIGGRGTDTLNGGQGSDLVSSSFLVPLTPPPSPPPPAPPPPPPPAAPSNFEPAVCTTVGTPVGAFFTTLTNGTGDFSLEIDLDATGEFAFQTLYDPAGAMRPADPVFVEQHEVSVNGSAFTNIGFNSTTSSFTSTGTEANSSFTRDGLNYVLCQTVAPLFATSGSTMGTVLAQTYTVANLGTASVQLGFQRYEHMHLDNPGSGNFFNGFDDGGGRLVLAGGTEVLFETSESGAPTQVVDFVGVTGIGGDESAPDRFLVDDVGTSFGLPTLPDTVTNDANGDGFIDAGNDGHYEEVLRNFFTIDPGETITYTTHTVFGSGAPANIGDGSITSNTAPLAANDTVTVVGGFPITFDVVSNDSDADGALDFTSILIATNPTNGTVVSLNNGLLTYTPNAGFSGTDSFTYTIADNNGVPSNAATVTITVFGADGENDVLMGGIDDDTLVGAFGNDTLNGQAGNDSLRGGEGNDLINGGAGLDTLEGEAGNDTLNGQGGNDSLNGGDGDDMLIWQGAANGNDTVAGGASGFDTAQINGDGSNNSFIVSASNGLLKVSEGVGSVLIDPDIRYVNVNGVNGNDTITVSASLRGVRATKVTINGDAGDDLLIALGSQLGSVRLELNGGTGNDSLSGSLDNDTLRGGDGNDNLVAGPGNDLLDGGAGDDVLRGQDGNDRLDGGDGTDLLVGDAGDDIANGGAGNDTANGGDGNDTLRGDDGNDVLNGNVGNDSLEGSVGQDILFGGVGNDTLDGGHNDDTLNGQAGNDKIRGDHGDDSIVGGDGDNTINGGDGNDTISSGTGIDFINGSDGDDAINSDGGDDIIVGGDGNDTLAGGEGHDIVMGNDGKDTVNGQGGTDIVAGGQGVDVVVDPVAEINEGFALSAVILTVLDAL